MHSEMIDYMDLRLWNDDDDVDDDDDDDDDDDKL